MRLKVLLFFLAGMVLLLSGGHPALAHKVNLFCHFEDGMLKGEGYYGGGRPARNAEIEVTSLNDNVLIAKTRTDDDGKFSVELNPLGPVRVVMGAGQGHRAEFIVEPEGSVSVGHDDPVGEKVIADSRIKGCVEDRIRSLEERIGYLEKRQSDPGMMTVIGGIGWIAGIFALIYLAKKKNAL